MKRVLLSILSFAILSLVTLPSLLGEDLNELAYRYRFLLKAGTILNSEGIGDCLLFPYYDVRREDGSSQVTEVNIENTSEYGVAAKLRVREWSQGREVFSADIWIPSAGVWSGRIELAGDGTNASFTSVHPVITNYDKGSFDISQSLASGTLFSILKKKKGSGPPLYGYIEVIGEEKTAPAAINSVVGRLAASEQDCPNSIKGSAVIQRVEEGVSMYYEAAAFGNFSRGQGSLFRSPGSPYPLLNNGEDSLDQLEFQLSKWEMMGPYSLNPSIQEKTHLIITFPTRHFHYKNFSKRINQIDNPFKASNIKTGEILRTTVMGESPGQEVDSTIALPFSVNVIGLSENYFGVPAGIDNGGLSTAYESGEVTLTSDHFAQRIMIQDFEYLQERFSTYRGLPALGLLLREYRNPDLQATITPVEFSAVWEASDLESVFIPAPPIGSSFGSAGVSYTFSVGGSASSLGHPIEYLIDWGDGTDSGWLGVGTTSASKTWTTGGVYTIRAKARCSIHTDIVSAWSDGLTVTIESVSAPTSISGPVEGIPNESYTYAASGAVSSAGHQVEYQFDWGDGATSEWGSGTQSKAWIQGGVYIVKARARCFIHPIIISEWSSGLTVTIETVSAPTTPVGPSAGSPDVEYTFGTGGAVSNLGHPVEYQFDWGDGTFSPWGPPTQTKSWNNYADFKIRARARCAIHTVVVSDWSGELSFSIELVTTPSQPVGTLNGMKNKPYTYTAGGAISSNGHNLEYQFDWGDGSTSPWTAAAVDLETGLSIASQTKVWTSSGTFVIKARARCSLHSTIVSDWSPGLPVVIEFASTPAAPSGPTSGTVGDGLFYSTGGSFIDSGHPVQYRFDWGDTTMSEWLPIGTTGVGKAWVDPGTYAVRAQARCAIHTEVISDWSPVFSVMILPGPPPQTETITVPFIEAYGPLDRGGLYTVGNIISGRKNIPYSFTFQPGVSNLQHAVEHQFDWKGDGSDLSAWGESTKAWPTSGTYKIGVRARCVQHPTVVSDWSSGLFVVIDSISTPAAPTWDAQPPEGYGHIGTAYNFSTAGGSTSEIGQEIQYRFHWGDATDSDSGWLPAGTTTASYTYAIQGAYTVRVEARGWWYLGADGHTEHFSYYSEPLMVTIRP